MTELLPRVTSPMAFLVDEDNKPTGKYEAGKAPEGVSYAAYVAVSNAVYVLWTKDGTLPSASGIKSLCEEHITDVELNKILSSDNFARSMASRGVPWRKSHGLSSLQMHVLAIVTDPTNKKPLATKLKQAGITYQQYRAWMREPAFFQYFNSITEGMLTDHIGDFNTVVTQKALNGDLNAIKYANELSGRHDPNKQAVLDLKSLVAQLLEIIMTEVTDTETLERIQTKFALTMQTQGLIPGGPSIKGEINNGPNS